jgi:hypothetical protein
VTLSNILVKNYRNLRQKLNIALILSKIKSHYNLRNNTKLSKFFELSPNTISTWIKRGSVNWELIFAKCDNMDFNYLIKDEEKRDSKIPPKNPDDPSAMEPIILSLLKENRQMAEEIGALKEQNRTLKKQIGYSNPSIAAEK